MITLEGVSLAYPGHPAIPALVDVDLRIVPGVTLVKGPGGSGKTTLLRVLATLITPDSGRIEFPWLAGGSLNTRLLRARIGYAPEKGVVGLSITVEGSLCYLAETRGVPVGSVQVARVLKRWHLYPLRRERLDRLSAGEMRRWLLAQSQLVDPDLWVLDEPARDLDAYGVSVLRAELAKYSPELDEGRYAIVSCHDDRLDEVARSFIRLEQGCCEPLAR